MAQWEQALGAVARERGPALVRYAYLLCGDWAQAEDLVQDALVKTFTRGRSGLALENSEGYVRRDRHDVDRRVPGPASLDRGAAPVRQDGRAVRA